MAYNIEFSPKAAKQFSSLDNSVKKRIKTALLRIQSLSDPRIVGKQLQGDLSLFWRYREGITGYWLVFMTTDW